eukprot:gene32096-49386_t
MAAGRACGGGARVERGPDRRRRTEACGRDAGLRWSVRAGGAAPIR